MNLAGVAIVYTSIACFQDRSGSWKPAGWMGLALGLGFFSKSTVLLFWFFPVVTALWLRGPRAVLRLAAYAVAAVRVRQPTARPVASFRKPNGRNSVDVYRLK